MVLSHKFVTCPGQTEIYGNKTIKTLNEWEDIVKVEYPDGSTKTTTYSTQYDQPIQEDEEGQITEYQLDDKGRIVLEIKAKGTAVERKTGYEYDAEGNVTSVTRYGSDDNSTTDDIIVQYAIRGQSPLRVAFKVEVGHLHIMLIMRRSGRGRLLSCFYVHAPANNPDIMLLARLL